MTKGKDVWGGGGGMGNAVGILLFPEQSSNFDQGGAGLGSQSYPSSTYVKL